MKKRFLIAMTVVALVVSGCSFDQPMQDSIEDNEAKNTGEQKTNDTDLVNQEQPSRKYLCKPNLDVFYVTPNSGSFKDQDRVTVWDVEKKNSENIYYVFEYPDLDFDGFLEFYRDQLAFPSRFKNQVLEYDDTDGNQRTLVDIGLEAQVWHTQVGENLVVVQDALGQKGCEGENCIQMEDFLDLLTCNPN